MANHKSAEKRIRQTAVRRLRNRYRLTTTRTMIKRLRAMTTKSEAVKLLPDVYALIDKCAKSSIFHANKAANLKSKLTLFVNGLN